jgi:hypothetical protein
MRNSIFSAPIFAALPQRLLLWSQLGICCCLLNACITTPYTAGKPSEYYGVSQNPAPLPPEAQITRGEPYALLDGLGHYFFSLPEKLILWNWNMGRHSISTETEALLRSYMAENQLPEVKVRLNEYDPLDEWQRLFDNQAVGWGYRYTVGIILNLYYTIIPGRLIGGDHYNPFTNTINIYSDHPAVALHEAGHARDTAQTEWKGTYALLRILPIMPLFDEEVATSEALSYFHDRQLRINERDAYKVLYPAFGTYVGGEFARWVPGLWWLSAAAAIPGHIVGRMRADEVEVPRVEGQAELTREQELEASLKGSTDGQPPSGLAPAVAMRGL